jgi:hypothetical protein
MFGHWTQLLPWVGLRGPRKPDVFRGIGKHLQGKLAQGPGEHGQTPAASVSLLELVIVVDEAESSSPLRPL